MLGLRRQPGLARTCLRRTRCLIPTQSRALKAKGVVTGEPNAPGHRGQGWGLWAPDAGFLQWPQNANPWTGPRGAPLGQGWALLGLGLSTAKAECSAAAAGLNSAAFLPRLPGLSPRPWCQVAWLRYLWGTGDPL